MCWDEGNQKNIDSLDVITDEDVNPDADVEVSVDADVADDNVITKAYVLQFPARCLL